MRCPGAGVGSRCNLCHHAKTWLPAAKTQGGIKGCSKELCGRPPKSIWRKLTQAQFDFLNSARPPAKSPGSNNTSESTSKAYGVRTSRRARSDALQKPCGRSVRMTRKGVDAGNWTPEFEQSSTTTISTTWPTCLSNERSMSAHLSALLWTVVASVRSSKCVTCFGSFVGDS